MKNDDLNDFFEAGKPLENNQDNNKIFPCNNDEETGLHEAIDDTAYKKELLRSQFWLYFEEVWPAFAIAFWAAFGIKDLEIFKRFKIFYLSHYYRMSNKGTKFRIDSTETNPIFAFKIPAKHNAINKECYYIYRPFDLKYKHSWLGEAPYNYIWGLDQLPDNPGYIILAAGRKDVIEWTNLGFYAVTLNSENSKLYPQMLEKLLSKVGQSNRIILAYDTDDTGIKRAIEMSKEFNFSNLHQQGYIPDGLTFPDGKKVKDISDLVRWYLLKNDLEGLEKYRQHLGRLVFSTISPKDFSTLWAGDIHSTDTVLKQEPMIQQVNEAIQKTPAITVTESSVESVPMLDEAEKIVRVTAAPSIAEPSRAKKRIRTANERMKDAESEPELLPVLGDLFKHGEIVVIYGDTGIGKTLLGIDASDGISFGRGEALGLPSVVEPAIVLYYDCELSDPMFRQRYLGYTFSDNLKIVVMNGLIDGEFSYETILNDIKESGANVVIVDNITKLSQSSNTEIDVARRIMEQLQKLRDAAKVSIMVFAHIIKVKANSPISLNHLGGSKYISNIADSVVALARSAKGKDIRYLKHVKKRNGAEDDKVLVYEIVKDNNFLRFKYLGLDTERNQLKFEGEKSPMFTEAKKLKSEGKSFREIAEILGVSKSTIGNWLNAFNE